MSRNRYMTEDQLALYVRTQMQNRGLTQRDVEAATGIVQPLVSKALRGGSPGVLCRIAEHVLGKSVETGYVRMER